MTDFNDFLKTLKTDLAAIASDAGEDIKNELVQDGTTFAKKFKADLRHWAQLHAEGKFTREQVEYLIEGKKDLAEMEALKQKGLAQARIIKLKNAMVGAVLGSALRTLS